MDNEKDLTELTDEEVMIPTADEEEENVTIDEDVLADEDDLNQEEEIVVLVEEPAAEGEKKNTFKVVLISVVATLLVLALAAGLTVGVLSGAGIVDLDEMFDKSNDSYAVTEKDAPKMAKKVVATIGDNKLTNGELQTYYKFNLLNLQQSEYAYYLYYYYGIDLTQPLDTLIYDETTGQTWQDLILENALNSWHEITVMNIMAKEEGFELNEEQKAYLDSIEAQTQQMATAAGYATVEDMIHADIGISATKEGFMSFMSAEYYYSCYYAHLMQKLTPTQEQIETYFAQNEQALAAEGITKETCTVDVRHILIQPEGGTLSEDGKTTVYSDEQWEACYQKAQQILETWKAGEATEDSFAELAKEHSADGNASQGGLYTGVTKGYMVEPFDTWIFDTTREFGNVDIVKTQFGYHVMFFVGREYTWISHCSQKMLAESLQYAIDSAKEKYPMEVKYNRIVLG